MEVIGAEETSVLEHPRMERRGQFGGRSVIEDLADRLMERVYGIEPSISKDLAEVASRQGARLVDLASKFKTRASIIRKMEQAKSYNPAISEKRLRRRVFDALRYTMVCQTESYAQTVKGMLADLREEGYEFEEKDVRNYWPEHELYKGINATLRLRGGKDVFKLQFHTDESWKAKNEAHPLYEKSRLRDTTRRSREELEQSMISIFGRIGKPPGVKGIGKVVKKVSTTTT